MQKVFFRMCMSVCFCLRKRNTFFLVCHYCHNKVNSFCLPYGGPRCTSFPPSPRVENIGILILYFDQHFQNQILLEFLEYSKHSEDFQKSSNSQKKILFSDFVNSILLLLRKAFVKPLFYLFGMLWLASTSFCQSESFF